MSNFATHLFILGFYISASLFAFFFILWKLGKTSGKTLVGFGLLAVLVGFWMVPSQSSYGDKLNYSYRHISQRGNNLGLTEYFLSTAVVNQGYGYVLYTFVPGDHKASDLWNPRVKIDQDKITDYYYWELNDVAFLDGNMFIRHPDTTYIRVPFPFNNLSDKITEAPIAPKDRNVPMDDVVNGEEYMPLTAAH